MKELGYGWIWRTFRAFLKVTDGAVVSEINAQIVAKGIVVPAHGPDKSHVVHLQRCQMQWMKAVGEELFRPLLFVQSP